MRSTAIAAAFTLLFGTGGRAPVSNAASKGAVEADGAVDSVVVFVDRARVTRIGAGACEKGRAKVTFARLPASLDTRTLRGEVQDAAEVVGVITDQVNEQQAVDPRARDLDEQQRKVQADIRSNEARRSVVAVEMEELDAYAGVFGATVSEEMRNPRPNTTLWAKTMESFRARRAARDDERRKLDIALRALQLQADRIAREKAHLGGGGGERAYRTASVVVDCRKLSRVTASLSYVVPGATWRPEYDLDFSPRARGKGGAGTARLTVGAVVRQATGEDWHAARLSLSTARPKLGAEAPLPAPLLVDGYEEKRDKVLVQAQERRDRLEGGGGPGAAGPTAAGLDDKGNAFVLSLPNRVTIVADGRPVWAPVDVRESSATVKLVTTPKLDEHVYQVIALKNPCAYPLIEGRMRSYRGGSYVGDAAFAYRGVGEPLEVSLGIDDEIKVERKTIDERDKSAGILSSTKHIVRAYRVTITNRSGGLEAVELRENIPVSLIDDVKVELVAKQTTPGYQLDARRGLITWSVPLKSGEWRYTDLGYAIHLPDSWQVGGSR
jgi:uncharacterized protein (TIGR02231 family)